MVSGGAGIDQLRIRVEWVDGDLLEQPVEVLVNPWNRNFVPRGLLVAHGVSGALKKHTGPGPWRALRRHGLLPLGAAVVTDAGQMDGPSHLIHVAGLNAWWKASSDGVAECVRNAVRAAAQLGVSSMAVPLIGAGTGGLSEQQSTEAISTALAEFPTAAAAETALRVLVVRRGGGSKAGEFGA